MPHVGGITHFNSFVNPRLINYQSRKCRSLNVRPIPNTISRSYTDTDTGNDVTHGVGHTYIKYVAHTIHKFQNITLLCFEMYIRYAYAVSSW